MKREYDEDGYPILTKEEWKAGMTPYDVQDADRFIRAFKITAVAVIVIAVIWNVV